jgi:hypothetical protein
MADVPLHKIFLPSGGRERQHITYTLDTRGFCDICYAEDVKTSINNITVQSVKKGKYYFWFAVGFEIFHNDCVACCKLQEFVLLGKCLKNKHTAQKQQIVADCMLNSCFFGN